ncbi:MAG: bifunctional 5,10-methylenetetrahydrofolate dehydrogenase/5,10-methenyltetrahydrofolate cyclohydrolase [Clostridia bacterium]|nr:bifunctional 5,10-methylenetetrahydrofolate dehydrogenase/5,10-methenyltetrahydrofolate cyclohydrolase [Clostridia bacterium]
MTELWKGAPVAEAILTDVRGRAEALRRRGIVPTLAVVRVGERQDDLAYERSAVKRCEGCGVAVRRVLPDAASGQAGLMECLRDLAGDPSVHGILLFQPLPAGYDGAEARGAIPPEKDVDGCTAGSQAHVYAGTPGGFAPCTAEAVVEILRFYGADPAGLRAVVIGRSLVIGRPAAMLLMHANATVTVCHRKTRDAAALAREADILVTAAGEMRSFGAGYMRPGQMVLDVGISWNEAEGRLCGDVRTEEAQGLVRAVTPVPGGVGAVTGAILVRHAVEAAERQRKGAEV